MNVENTFLDFRTSGGCDKLIRRKRQYFDKNKEKRARIIYVVGN
jgi:hypothetical protein